jgi:hypothetical protein
MGDEVSVVTKADGARTKFAGSCNRIGPLSDLVTRAIEQAPHRICRLAQTEYVGQVAAQAT